MVVLIFLWTLHMPELWRHQFLIFKNDSHFRRDVGQGWIRFWTQFCILGSRNFALASVVWTENFQTRLNREIRRAPSGDFEFGAGSDLINDGKMTPKRWKDSLQVNFLSTGSWGFWRFSGFYILESTWQTLQRINLGTWWLRSFVRRNSIVVEGK